MKHSTLLLIVTVIAPPQFGCDSKSNSADQGREAVKEVVTQPFNTLENAHKVAQRERRKNQSGARTGGERIELSNGGITRLVHHDRGVAFTIRSISLPFSPS